jgi:HD domain
MSSDARDITGFLYEMGLLKRYPRTGWSLAGVPVAESVAEHSFRTSVIASVIAAMEGADPQHAAFLALWHDTQETRTTDLPYLAKRYVTAAPNLQPWIDSSIASLHTAAARQLADEALTQNSLDWLQRARHGQPRRSDQLPSTRRLGSQVMRHLAASPRSSGLVRPVTSSPETRSRTAGRAWISSGASRSAASRALMQSARRPRFRRAA